MNAAPPLPLCFAFGRCEIFVARRQFKYEGRIVPLTDRAYDILIALVARRGQIVSKAELMREVWPDRFIEDNTLEGQVSLLRRHLAGDRDAIRTVAGRGYQFVGEMVTLVNEVPRSPRQVIDLPVSLSPLIGREADLSDIAEVAASHRLVTLVGTGGVGKTRLAVECARALAPAFPDRIAIAELAPLTSPSFVALAVTSALGFPPADGQVLLDRMASVLHEKKMLLLLDNCEHVIEEATRIVEIILRASPLLHVIATSREPLRVEGEYVYRVPSLDLPDEGCTAVDPSREPAAMRLFFARLDSRVAYGSASFEDRAAASRICRRLDGIPLAIELAATRAPALGISGVAALLDNRFELLGGGKRTAPPRHQTLRATLDWSYELLSEAEREAFETLSVFPDQFSLDSALSVLVEPTDDKTVVFDSIASLVAKSLLNCNMSRPEATYGMLESTRAYAKSKLDHSGRFGRTAVRHAKYFLARFEAVEHRWDSARGDELEPVFRACLADLRVAIQRSLSDGLDVAAGIALVTAAIPFWVKLSHTAECVDWVSTALELSATQPQPDAICEMKLHAARGLSLMYAVAAEDAETNLNTALDIAERLNNDEYRLKCLWGQWELALGRGALDRMMVLAQRFTGIAQHSADRLDRLVAERMLGMSWLRLSGPDKARPHIERAVVGARNHPDAHPSTRYLYDQETAAWCALASVSWLQGRPDAALQALGQARDRSRLIAHAASVWYAHTMGMCPIELLTEGVAAVESPTAYSLNTLCRYGMSTWRPRSLFWQGILLIHHGDIDAYDRVIAPLFERNPPIQFTAHLTGYLSAVCDQLIELGRLNDALHLVNPALEHAEAVGDVSTLPELVRLRGELVLAQRLPGSEGVARAAFERAIAVAASAHFVSWELRAATSLARLLVAQGETSEARTRLEAVYAKFAEGFNTADLRAARMLLQTVHAERLR